MSNVRNRNWAAITTSRNDKDFLELFFRANHKFIDEFFLIDDSTDESPEIIHRLLREGFPIRIYEGNGIISRQDDKVNFLLNECLKSKKSFDAIIPLDVDEVIYSENTNFDKHSLNYEDSGSFMYWSPFVARDSKNLSQFNSLKNSFIGTSNSAFKTKKVFLPRKSIRLDARIETGSHNYKIGKKSLISHDNGFLRIAHFPIRTDQQLISKVMTGLTAVRLKENRLPSEGTHLVAMAKVLIASNFNLNLSHLQYLGAFYGHFNESIFNTALEFNDLVKFLPEVDFSYYDLSLTNLAKDLSFLIAELTDLLINKMKIDSKLDKPYNLFFN